MLCAREKDVTMRLTLALYEGDDFYVLLTNPNALDANVKIYLKEDPQTSYAFKMKPREFKVVELHKLDQFKGKRGTVMVEADVGLLVEFGERLCSKCKRGTLEFIPVKIADPSGNFEVKYEWVCRKCGHKEVEGTLRAVKKDGGLELAFEPSK